MDSGSSLTAMSDSLYQTLVYAGALVGALGCTSKTLSGANGIGIGVSGCSHCVVSFMGLLTKFPILVCDLASGMDAIIGTDVLGSVLPHTLDTKNGLLFTEGGALLQLYRRHAALSGRVFHSWALLRSSLFRSCITLYHTYCWRTSYALGGLLEGLTVFAENTGLVVGRTLVDPSRWRVPVLVSNVRIRLC